MFGRKRNLLRLQVSMRLWSLDRVTWVKLVVSRDAVFDKAAQAKELSVLQNLLRSSFNRMRKMEGTRADSPIAIVVGVVNKTPPK